MTVGMAGAGFCLVLAMVVLVVTLGGGASTRPPPGAVHSSTSPSELSGRGHRYRTTIVNEPVGGNGTASAVRYGLGLLVAEFRGVGPVQGDRFQITRPGDWGISWQFSCPQGQPGDLTVRADDAAGSGPGQGQGQGYGRRLSYSGNGNGKTPPGQAKKHKIPPGQARKHKIPPGQAKKHNKHESPPGQAKKHKEHKTPPGQAKKSRNHGSQAHATHRASHGRAGRHQNSRVTLTASGYHGRGMSWYTSDPGDHILDVSSGCTWVIKIVLPKP
jgi:hypothetical protein